MTPRKYLSATQARALIATIKPRGLVGKTRRRLVVELISELSSIDRKIKDADKELQQLVIDRGSTLMDLHGIGPSSAARLLADVANIHRFRDRDRFASWNGTAPIDASSGEHQRHRLSRAGNRRINRALHIMAVVQLRNPTEGRAFFDAKKAAGKTSMEAMRALKRRLSNVVYSRMIADQRQRERQTRKATPDDSAIQRDRPNPKHRSSDKPRPGPATSQASPGHLLTPGRRELGGSCHSGAG